MNTSPRPFFESAEPDHWRNLLWALATPDIAPEFPLPWLPEHRRRQLHQFFCSPHIATRLRPKLEASLQTLNSHRLGVYFEQLWDFAFTHHPDYTLLARNLAIRSEGQTLGELDFVVRHLPDNAVEHWEVAVKFYLRVDDHWVGPGLRDRLDIKLARMRDHQLPVARSRPGLEALRHLELRLDRQWTLMPGRLFTPLAAPAQGPQASRYWWATSALFLQYFLTGPRHWLPLQKTSWLAPVDTDSSDGYSPVELRETVLPSLLARGPVCIAATTADADETEPFCRGFIVPDGWYPSALSHHLT